MTLGEAATRFLNSLPAREREKNQQEVYQFVRWYGWERECSELTVPEVANYGERVVSPTMDPAKKLEPARAFLSYAHKNGLTKNNLAIHLRVKKGSARSTVSEGERSAEVVLLTSQGYAELQAELSRLKSQRPQMAEELRKAAADKDFRENAPLEAAREQQGHLEGRIRELESILSSSVVMEEKQVSSCKAKIGSTIILRDLNGEEELHYALVSPTEANLAKGKVSVASPIGKALLGRQEDEVIEVVAPGGVLRYRIERIQR